MVSWIQHPVKREIAALVTMNQERFSRFDDLQVKAAAHRAIVGPADCDWETMIDYYKASAEEMALGLGISSDYVVSRVLTKSNVVFLNNLRHENVLELRRAGKLGELREFFRSAINRVRVATLDNFDSTCSKVETEMERILDEYAREVELDKDLLAKRMKLASLSLLAAASISIATAAVPLLVPLAGAATAASLLVGSASVKDLVNLHLSGQCKKKELSQRPIGVFLATRTEG